MRASLLFCVSVCLAFTSVPATSQVPASAGAVRTHIEGIDIPPVPNAPFSAKVVVTWDEPLVGGGMVSRKYYTLVARDSQGRVHRETREFIPANSTAEPQLRGFTITDPISSTRTTCTEASMGCAAAAFHPRIPLAGDAAGAVEVSAGNLTRESLGQQTMNGVLVVGTRETVTNVAGSNGSSRLALSHTESWYSPDLHMDVAVTRNNPQLGQVILKVTDLVRSEPDPSWFAVPSGYEVKDARNK
jgi:hypothetical protein